MDKNKTKKEPTFVMFAKTVLGLSAVAGFIVVSSVALYVFTRNISTDDISSDVAEIRGIEISSDGKSILSSETKAVIFTIADTQKYLKESGYAYDPDTFQNTNAKYAGDCFLSANLSSSGDRIVFSSGCLPGDLPQAWVGVYDSGTITKQTLDCAGLNSSIILTAFACIGEQNPQPSIYFLIGGSGRNFVWSADDKTITYEANLGLSGMTETRTIDSAMGEILEKGSIEDNISDWQIYRNEEYGFEVKYPSNLISDNKVISDPHPIYLLLWDKEMHNKFEKGEITQPYLWIISESLEDLSLEKWIESRKTDISEKEYITFGDIKFLRIYEQGYANGTYLFYITKKGTVFTIGTSTNKTDPVLSQILSTFKFMDKAETASRKTYVNQTDCYAIKYADPYRIWLENDLTNYDFNDPKYERGNPDGVKIQIQKLSLGDKKNLALQISELNEQTKKGTAEDTRDLIQKLTLGNFQYFGKVLSGPGGSFDMFYASATDNAHYYAALVWGMKNDPANVESILKTFSATDC